MSARLNIIPDNPAPSGAEASMLTAHDRRALRYAAFPPLPGSTPRGTVVVLTGRNEAIEKYFETVGDLARRGFAAVAMDWRGQGGSDRLLRDPQRGHVRSFEDYAADLERLVREVVLVRCPTPVFVLAHSMGGLVALLALPKLQGIVERMVLSAPLLGLQTPVPQGSVHRLSRALSRLGFGTRYLGGGPATRVKALFPGNPLTSDPERFARNGRLVAAFPQLALGGPTIAWVRAACDAMAAVSAPAFAAAIRTPVLFVAAGADTVVSTRATEAYARRLSSATLVTVDGARHELLQEVDRFRDQFLAAFDAFVPGTPQPAENVSPSMSNAAR